MKNTTPLLTTVACATILFLTGCATGRPPRQIGGRERTVEPTERPKAITPERPMPPAFEPVDEGISREPIDVEPAAADPAPAPRKFEPKSGNPYTIKKGETLSSVAARHRMGWKELAEYNLIENPDRVREGQVILLPPKASARSSAPAATRRDDPPAEVGAKTHTVRSGDSLSAIAVRYGTTVKALKRVNDLAGDKILVGQVLTLPDGAEAPARSGDSGGSRRPAPRPTPVPTRPIPPRPGPESIDVDVDPVEDTVPDVEANDGDMDAGLNIIDKPYPIIVREGDTLESIAENYIVTVEEIRKLNDLKPGEKLEAGQELMMPATLY